MKAVLYPVKWCVKVVWLMDRFFGTIVVFEVYHIFIGDLPKNLSHKSSCEWLCQYREVFFWGGGLFFIWYALIVSVVRGNGIGDPTDWFWQHVNYFRVILCQEVQESHSLYVQIYKFSVVFKGVAHGPIKYK